MSAALQGLLVVELGSRIGVGACGSLLAQLGAEVVMIEPSADRNKVGKYRHRAVFAAGKRSLNRGKGDTLAALAALADVVLVSSDLDGKSEPVLGAIRAGAIVCDVTAHGRNAVYERPPSEWQIQAETALIETTGLDDGPPLIIPLPVVELMTGCYAAAAIVAAWYARITGGSGQWIDMALYDCAFCSLATFLPRALTGDASPTRRVGNRHTMIAPWNVYKAQDGWILICVGSDAQWRRLCEIMGRLDLREGCTARTAERVANTEFVDDTVQRWVGARSLAACVAALNDAQIACGPIAVIDDFPREANLDHRAMICQVTDPDTGRRLAVAGSPLRMSASPGRSPGHVPVAGADDAAVADLVRKRSPRPAAPASARKQTPLAGIRVVEIGHYTTVPLCTRLLGSLGAEVVKIEPPEGEATRTWPPAHSGQGYFFTYMNADKRSLMLDLRQEKDAGILRDLLRDADALVENLKPGALSRRGFSPATLAALNPRLIYCAVSGFGADSLYAGRPAYDSVIQAMSGIMDVLRAGNLPVKAGISIADLMGAEMAVLALLAALVHRTRTGQGQTIDLSMQDIAAWITQTAWNGADPVGARLALVPCADGFVLVETAPPRITELSDLVRTMSKGDAAQFLSGVGIVATAISDVAEVVSAPLTAIRALWRTVAAEGAEWPLLANPMRLEATPPQVQKPMPPLGRDNHAVVADLANRSVQAAATR